LTIEERLNEPRRLAALRGTGLLDSGPEEPFDQICRIASELLHAPSAFVSLVAGNRQYLKSTSTSEGSGVDDFDPDVSLDSSFCKYAVASGQPFLVEDARKMPLVRDNDAVRRGVIAYAGVPFHADGEAIGAICVVDSQPRRWSDGDVDKLRSLARSLEELIAVGPGRAEAPENDGALRESLGGFLRALDRYRAILAASHVDLGLEREARHDLVARSEALHRDFARAPGVAPGSDTLIVELRRYLGAEERRRKAAERFAAGTGDLGELQDSIAEVSHAEDSLRIAALDSGIPL
jgi:hypothetical protein